MSRIVIVGAGALGREIRNYIERIGNHGRIAFLDDVQPRHHTLPILGRIDESAFLLNDSDTIYVACGDGKGREKMFQLLGDRDPMSFRHPTTVGEPSGFSYTMLPFTLCSTNVIAGDGLLMHTYASLGHDCQLGEFVTLCSHVSVLGRVRIGDRTFVGSGVTICPDVTIGKDAFIGVGSVVVRDVPDGARVFGNPARSIAA